MAAACTMEPAMTGCSIAPLEAQLGNTFADYAKAGFLSELIPIIPPGVALSSKSKLNFGTRDSRGKIPGRKIADGWVGFPDWTEYRATIHDLAEWQSSNAGIGLQGRLYPALDLDVDDEELADALQSAAETYLGEAPTRFGRGARRLLPYAAEGLTRRAFSFQRRVATPETMPVDGEPPAEAVHVVEFLGDGQQYVVEGIHPKTLAPYRWVDGRSPAAIGTKGLTIITAAQVEEFFAQVETLMASRGYEVVSRSSSSSRKRPVCQAGLLAPSIGAVERALAALENDVDYFTWLKVGAAIKAASGTENEAAAYDLWLDWSLQYGGNDIDIIAAKWASLRAPFSVGWDFLQRFATQEGDGTFYGAAEEFDPVTPTPSEEELAEAKADMPLTAMFNRFVWVQRLARVADTKTGDLLGRDQFNVLNRHIGPPTETKACAWAVLTSSVNRLQMAQAVTYRPGAGRFVDEDLPGLTGRCVNLWRPTLVDIPAVARYEDVAKWLEHVAFVLPNEQERETVLDWLSWIIQNPGEKPNWAVVMGSSAEGLGKDLTLEPVRVALGAANVREIDADDLASGYSDYLAGTRLLIVEEMQMHERKAMMNRLKPLIAAPPHTLRVNVKFQPQYEIPNLIATIFFTNMENALAISAKDRRYFVTWNEAQPKPDTYYTELVAWFDAGGAAHAARWLLDRDVSSFSSPRYCIMAVAPWPVAFGRGSKALSATPGCRLTSRRIGCATPAQPGSWKPTCRHGKRRASPA